MLQPSRALLAGSCLDRSLIEPDLKRALAERQIHEETQKALLASAKKCQTTDERKALASELAALQDEAGELPTVPRLLADDATPEALAVLMSKHNQRIAMLEAEGGFSIPSPVVIPAVCPTWTRNLMTNPMPTMVPKSPEAKAAFTKWHIRNQ